MRSASRFRSCVVVAAVIGAVGCSNPPPPKIGAACDDSDFKYCLDGTSRAVCADGKYRLEKCSSCTQTFERGLLETTSNMAAANCVLAGVGPEGAACEGKSVDCDGSTFVECVDGVFHRYPCGGAKGCYRDEKARYSCDLSVSNAGDPCMKEGTAGCTADGHGVVHCRDGVFKLDKSCAGPKGCTSTNDSVVCDITLAKLGEPCINGGACSVDGSSILACVDHAYAMFRECRGEQPGCTVDEDNKSVRCRHPELAEAGDHCQDDVAACSVDGKELLHCQKGRFTIQKKCKKGCKESGGRVNCK